MASVLLALLVASSSALIKESSSFQAISSLPFSGVSALFNSSTQTFYFLSGKLNYQNYLTGMQTIYYDSVYDSWRYFPLSYTSYPQDRSFYGSFHDGGKKYCIFGGIGPGGIYQDMWCYDLVIGGWSQVQTNNIIPRRYFFASTSFTLNNKQYFAVLGGIGYGQDTYLDDFYL